MPGRKYQAGSASYRYSINGQEKSDEINENLTTAQYWEYDSRLARRWNIDPVKKDYESPYLSFAANPIWIKDNNGADSIFYNQNGTENHRVKKTGDHTYWLQHKDGNMVIAGHSYFKGNSYYSFYGDADRFKEPTLFAGVEKGKFPDLSKATLEKLVAMQYNGETYYEIWYNSGASGTFDYKNSKYFNENHGTGKEASNLKTAYLIDGVLYNRNEMGLILWGGAMGKTNTGYTGLYLDNKAVHLVTEGNNDELNEMNTWRMGWLIVKGEKNIRHYNNTFMYGVFGLYYNNRVEGVDPTNSDGLYYDDWKILGHDRETQQKKSQKIIENGMKGWRPY